MMARRTSLPVRIGADLVGIVVFLACVFPVYWMVSRSFLPRNRIKGEDPVFVPTGGTLDNYRRVFSDGSFTDALVTSLTVTLLTVGVALLFAFLAAVAVSRFRFRGRRTFILTLLVIQMIPAEALFISQYKMLDGMSLLNSVIGLTIVYVASVLPFTVWTLRGFVDGVPRELEEAAMMDGCSRTGAFFKVTLPLLAPGLVATGVFAFIQAWNEFTLAVVVMTDPDKKTLPVWLVAFTDSRSRGVDWGAIMASSTLITIPVIIFFLVVQRRMVSGITAGAVKG
ncbi:sugar ABC transporter permease [Nocardioides sp. Root79]|nr:sugar ABC transporter permease [Nocardioides sp. Root79]KRC72735.1 sugar ABC transporter permease [Nocardioides sp. Root240]